MSKHIDFLSQQTGGRAVRVAAQGFSMAVVVTDEEVIVGNTGLFGRFGTRVTRYARERIAQVGIRPNRDATMLQMSLVSPDEQVFVLFESSARDEVDTLVETLRSAPSRRAAGAGQ
jgi:hypothetical protein